MKLIDFASYKELSLFPHRPLASGPELTEDDLATILNETQEVRARAYYVGLNLKLSTDVLDSIMLQYSDNLDRLLHILKEFLRRVEPRPTWSAVVIALQSPSVGLHKLADEIENKYCSTPKSEPDRGMLQWCYQVAHARRGLTSSVTLAHARRGLIRNASIWGTKCIL